MRFFPGLDITGRWARFAGALLAVSALTGSVQAASLVPAETFCDFGCDIPDLGISDAPVDDQENPLQSFVPSQSFIGDFTAGPGDLLHFLRSPEQAPAPAEDAPVAPLSQ